MAGNETTKISLSTFFLILAIIAIIIMGIFIYKLNNDKTAEIQKSTELQSQVNSLTETVNDLQGKIANISKTINTDFSNESNIPNNNSKDNNTTTTTLSETEALDILKSKYDIIEKIYFSPSIFFNVTAGEEIKDFDKTILKYGTDNFLKEVKNNLPMCIRLENGKYYFIYGGGALEYSGFDRFENIKVTNSTITATLITKQVGPNPENPNDGGAWIEKEDKSSEFILVKNGNDWLIDKFNSSDFN